MSAGGLILVVMALLGGLVGYGLAILSVWLPEEKFTWKGRRPVLIGLAGAVVGVWAVEIGGGQWLVVGATAVLGWQLLLIAIVDQEHFWLPDELTWPLIGTGLAAAVAMSRGLPWGNLVGAGVGFGGLWLLAELYRRVRGRKGLGGGDPFLLAGAGAWVGWSGLATVLLAACGVGFSIVMLRLLLRRPVSGTDRLPFGTYMAAGIWIAWLMAVR